MAIVKCKECSHDVSTRAEACPHCGAKRPKPTSLFTWVVVIFFSWLVFTCVSSSNKATKSTAAAPQAATSTDRLVASSARRGWLLDYDRRNQVILWKRPGPPAGNEIAAVVKFTGIPAGESMITDVAEQRDVNGIIYYRILFDEKRQGWVDVDYLHWKKVRR